MAQDWLMPVFHPMGNMVVFLCLSLQDSHTLNINFFFKLHFIFFSL